MRFKYFNNNAFTAYLVVALFIAATGCQQQTSSEPSNEQAAVDVVKQENTNSDVNSKENSDAAADVEQLEADEQTHGGRGTMRGRGPRMGRGPGAMGGMRPDMATLHAMFASRHKISRTVKNLPDGAEAVTESDDDDIVSLLQEHVPAMEGRVLNNEPLPPMTFHPIFVELIKNSDKYSFTYDDTEKGVKVTYASDDPYVVMLVQEHAKLVSRFLKNGMEEIHKPYTLPKIESRPASQTQATTSDPKKSAVAAKEALFKRLSGRLSEVMQSQGPAAAIEVCSREASQIAIAVGNEYGVRIGRTATKLRNPSNKPPSWVEPLLRAQPAKPQFVELSDGHIGALLPIKLKAKCITCHGPQDQIPAEVKTKLATLYPTDQATGFNEGDLRGWFWVETGSSSKTD